jgi:glycosyltransferase involved in cell wall biosynthesis
LDVLVLPSETQQNWKEQFGRVIPEALACGAAIVGSDSGEIPHLIRQSGGGLVFRERDSDALAQALRIMITEPRRRAVMASAGRAWVIDNISLESVAKRMIATFEDALNVSSTVAR